MPEDYVRRLENCVKQMLKPLKGVPFNLVIEQLSGHRVLPFGDSTLYDRRLLKVMREAVILAGTTINRKGILSRRANEVGNYIEPFVKNAMNQHGLKADVPRCQSGKRKASGYPDIEFIFEDRVHYAECKTYNARNFATTQRSFYFSPSKDFKVTCDAHHFLFSYEVYEAKSGPKNLYRCRHWRILSLGKLAVDVKFEFNSDNIRLYGDKAGARTLDEGEL